MSKININGIDYIPESEAAEVFCVPVADDWGL
jgi:hypothetical protein